MNKIEDRPVSSLLDISGRKAIVTGGAMGLGFGIAKRLAEAGADVLISDVNESALEKAVGRMSEEGYQIETRVVDSGRERRQAGSVRRRSRRARRSSRFRGHGVADIAAVAWRRRRAKFEILRVLR